MKKVFFTFLMMLLPMVASAYDVVINGIYYNYRNDGKELEVTYKNSNYNSYYGVVRIPDKVTYGGKTMTVTSISNLAFYNCSGLTSVTIPSSVTSIGQLAFCYVGSLTSIVVESGNNSYDSRGGCNAIIKTIDNELVAGCKNTVIPNSVTSIGRAAFWVCRGLTSITIPNSVKSIKNEAFEGCTDLTSITIPNSVTSIGSEAFSGCSGLTSIVVESDNKVYDSRGGCNAIIKTSDNELIAGCKNTVIPNSVTSIGHAALYNCSGLTSVTIPNSVTSIGSDAFGRCSGLTSITIPNSVTSIGSSAFSGCSVLTSVTIPSSVTSIGNNVFSSCTDLASIVVESGNNSYDSRGGCNAIIKTSDNELIAGCKNTVIPSSVTSIGSSAFSGCSGLTSITIPNSVKSIGSSAFSGCTGLTSITIPNSVTNIGGSTFNGCSGLTSVIIPNSVISIGSSAFSGCSGLTNVYCYAKNVPETAANAFSSSSINSATLHVPDGWLEAYQTAVPWDQFQNTVALTGSNPDMKCAKPTINLVDGILNFSCETEGVTFKVSYNYNAPNETLENTQLNLAGTTTVHVSVYATKNGYQDSDAATSDVELCVGQKGDVNQDGKITITDAVSVVNIILNNGEATAPTMESPDVEAPEVVEPE